MDDLKKEKLTAIIISVSSDIGTALANRWLNYGWNVAGTYLTDSDKTKKLYDSEVFLTKCDMRNKVSLNKAISALAEKVGKWDVLVMCPATQEPVGNFIGCNFNAWEESIGINFTSHYRIIHDLLPFRNLERNNYEPCVLFFAGGGTNNATINYSAYTISKIAQIKMCELLDAEISDSRFTILGPGWVKTKIHEATLKAKEKAGDNYQRTIDKLAGGNLTPVEKVVDCCDWVIKTPRSIVSGRNFSVASDKWGSDELNNKLASDSDMYKLRRFGNNWGDNS